MNGDLPHGWTTAPFMDVFDIEGGRQPPKKTFKYEPTSGYIRLLQIRDFGEKPLPTFIRSKPTLKTCRKEDILIGRYGASVGRICTGMDGAYNVALTKVIIPESVSRRYVFWLLQSPTFQSPLHEIERSAQNGFNKEDLAEIMLPLAPVAEQRRIVMKLEKLLGHVNSCQERLTKIPTLLKRFRQAVLAAACSGQITTDWRGENETKSVESELISSIKKNKKLLEAFESGRRYYSSTPFEWNMFPELPENWCWGAAAEVVEPGAEIVYGIVQPGPEVRNGIPYVRGLDIQNGKILLTQLRHTSRAIADKYERASLKGGDVLLGIIRNTKVAVVPDSLRGGNITQGTARFRPSHFLITGFLAFWLESTYAQEWLHGQYRGIDMPGLNLADVRKLPVPLPPISEQEEIVHRVEKLFALADRLEARFAEGQKRVDSITQSLLAKAFCGELVPKEYELAKAEGRSFESAEELLERIKSNGKPKTDEKRRVGRGNKRRVAVQ